MRKNQIELCVNWGDTDRAGIVFYPNYFKWFDLAGHQFFRSIGLAPKDLEEQDNIIIPLLDVRCTFENPLYYDDKITIITSVAEINRKTIKLNHEVFRKDIRTGHGYELRGWVEKLDGKYKAVPIPDSVREVLASDSNKSNYSVNHWFSA
jgi:acyl-CoA thioester hydrolase